MLIREEIEQGRSGDPPSRISGQVSDMFPHWASDMGWCVCHICIPTSWGGTPQPWSPIRLNTMPDCAPILGNLKRKCIIFFIHVCSEPNLLAGDSTKQAHVCACVLVCLCACGMVVRAMRCSVVQCGAVLEWCCVVSTQALSYRQVCRETLSTEPWHSSKLLHQAAASVLSQAMD